LSALLDLSLAELAAKLRTGEVTARAATEAALEALDGRGRELRAVARLWPEKALARAEALDRARAEGRVLGPLHGVPLATRTCWTARASFRSGGRRSTAAGWPSGPRP
jgi:aspartyl-tRNA(Asn)/glutamyl-tRNA(Gln) amidotransferase subunit A